MSLRWIIRDDLYQRAEEQFKVKVIKTPGIGVALHADVLWYDDDNCLCQESCFEPKLFESMTSCEMFLSRKKREYNIKVDGLISRTYYYDKGELTNGSGCN